MFEMLLNFYSPYIASLKLKIFSNSILSHFRIW